MLAGVRVYPITDIWLTREAFRTIRERERNESSTKKNFTTSSISLKVVKQLLVPLNKFFINGIQCNVPRRY